MSVLTVTTFFLFVFSLQPILTCKTRNIVLKTLDLPLFSKTVYIVAE